jgi:hypothetical protein
MDTDIRDEIESSFGDGPPLTGDDGLLSRAHGALLRRRLAESVAVVAVALVAVTGAGLLAGGDGPSVEPMPAGPPTGATESKEPAATFPPAPTSDGDGRAPGAPVVRDPQLPADTPVDAQVDGLHVAPGVGIEELRDDPWQVRDDGDWSVAVAYTAPGGPLTWWVGYVGADGGGSSASIAAEYARGLGFDAWVAAQGEGVRPGDDSSGEGTDPPGGWPGMTDVELVRFVEGTERLEPVTGVTLVHQREHPDLPRSWADPGDRSAVAEVERAGTRYYVLARSTRGDAPPQYIAVRASEGGATLDDFLEFARERYGEGGGGLL